MQTHYECFAGKVAVVSGAAQGIGQAVAEQLQQAGAVVARLDVQYQAQAQLQEGAFATDISSLAQVETALAQIERNLGPIEYLVNAAGILKLAPALEQTPQDWLETFSVNTHGAFYLCRTAARYMTQRRCGAIVAITSNAARVPRMDMAAYAASKAATDHMLRCLGLELAQFNVRCNSVCPGSTYTQMQQQCWRDASDEQRVIDGVLEKYRLGIPLQRIASPHDIANSVLFLLSDRARHITLASLTVDAGATLGC